MSSEFLYLSWINSFLKVFRCKTEDFKRLCEGLRHICLSGHAELPPLVSLVINQMNSAKRWLITTKWQHDRWNLASSISIYLLVTALNCQPLCESAFLLVSSCRLIDQLIDQCIIEIMVCLINNENDN